MHERLMLRQGIRSRYADAPMDPERITGHAAQPETVYSESMQINEAGGMLWKTGCQKQRRKRYGKANDAERYTIGII